MSEMRKEIIELLNSDISAYRINKDTGVNAATVQTLRSGDIKLDNITFKNAERLAAYAENHL
ncbi:MAG: hypothetical protein MR008_04800 [Aerococcus sp.]|nr:hypothetical protein [Aerococcus sp.]